VAKAFRNNNSYNVWYLILKSDTLEKICRKSAENSEIAKTKKLLPKKQSAIPKYLDFCIFSERISYISSEKKHSVSSNLSCENNKTNSQIISKKYRYFLNSELLFNHPFNLLKYFRIIKYNK
jgi:hypothetical protein